ncbi:MAG TPA: glycosyltransferase [Nitrososphaera sp.]|jgi:cellulose synthase/poly-beta-1,6-N-acetylglucosamine synthase-like glycosyltransferase|nr:glycosyltransferase [Nitrososphaera sp.]
MYGPGPFLYVIFLMIGWILMLYTLNFYYLAYQSRNNIRHNKKMRQRSELPANLPVVTIQLPLYNEKYVAKRLIDAVCRMDYPKDKLHIQVLDDSDDDTVDLIKSIVDDSRFKGFDIVLTHRTDRSGYKAGALKAGMEHAKGEFITIFDADFIPPAWFLKKALGHFFTDEKLGFVQCKWGHVNENYSTLTEAQAVSLDLHFMIEQKAKSFTHLYMNFNGTAGIWRTSCIKDAGGWHTTTLVEDLDLSYRAQMKGWKCLFLEGVEVDAELPVQMNAAKRQQFRWAKGSIQVALKLLSDVMLHRRVPADTKVQAFIQLTRHIVSPLFLAQFLIFPMLLAMNYELYTVGWAPLISVFMYTMMGPGGYLLVISQTWNGNASMWREKARQFFFLMFFSSGISVNNTVAVFDAVFGKKNEFLRTPKFGIVNKDDDWRNKEYVLPFTKTTLLEIFFAIYGCMAVFISLASGNAIFAPMMAVPTIGFIYVAYLSIVHSSFRKKNKRGLPRRPYASAIVTGKHNLGSSTTITSSITQTRSLNQQVVLAGVLAFLVMGAGIAYYGYQTTMYPINKAVGFMSRAQTAQTPEQLAEYAELTKDLTPAKGNPVWLFPTPRTDFALIQENLDGILMRAEASSMMVPHSEEYNMAMRDMHKSVMALNFNLMEAVPYMYISFNNIVMAGLWVAAVIAIFAATRKARARVQLKTV